MEIFKGALVNVECMKNIGGYIEREKNREKETIKERKKERKKKRKKERKKE